jgi:hypothetical protein
MRLFACTVLFARKNFCALQKLINIDRERFSLDGEGGDKKFHHAQLKENFYPALQY